MLESHDIEAEAASLPYQLHAAGGKFAEAPKHLACTNPKCTHWGLQRFRR